MTLTNSIFAIHVTTESAEYAQYAVVALFIVLLFLSIFTYFKISQTLKIKGLPNFVIYIIGGIITTLFTLPVGLITEEFYYISILFGLMFPFLILVGDPGINIQPHAKLKKTTFMYNMDNASSTASLAAATDPAWDEKQLTQFAVATLNRFWYDWERLDIESIKQYASKDYVDYLNVLLYGMQQEGRIDQVRDIKILDIAITSAEDHADNTKDQVGVAISYKANRNLIDTSLGKTIFHSDDNIAEQWNFVRSARGWQLDGISYKYYVDRDSRYIKGFAKQNGMLYGGRQIEALQPIQGKIFKDMLRISTTKDSTIAFWPGNVLAQIYSYSNSKFTASDGEIIQPYLVGQLNLPNNYNYGNIRVERKNSKSPIKITPRGYREITLKWPELNKAYNIYASNDTSSVDVNLLNLKFLSWIYYKKLYLNLEIAGNIIYFYAPTNYESVQSEAPHYLDMLNILRRAYKELGF